MATLWQDLRYGVRMLMKKPGVTLIATLSLALGIGANTSIFSIINVVFLRQLPVTEPSRLMFVFNGTRNSPWATVSYPNYVDYRGRVEVFSELAAYGRITVSLSGDDAGFGLAPALQSSRPDLLPSLKDESYSPVQSRRRFTMRHLLVVAQVALSLVLLIGAGLFLRSLWRIQSVRPGFDADKVLTASLNINLLRYTTRQGRDFYGQVIERVESLPGVESASLARVTPISGGGRSTSFVIEGQDEQEINRQRNEGRGAL
jgi:hypothetical protein